MEKVIKEVDLELDGMTMHYLDNCMYQGKIFEYKFTSTTLLPIIHDTKIFIEVDEPETIKEFLQEKNIDKKSLVEWLNKNYK